MAETMIERVARHLCEREGGDPDEVRHGEGHASGRTWTGWQAYASDARAIITVIREPTEEMVEAGCGSWTRNCECTLGQITKAQWQAMSDAALAEEKFR